MTTRKLQHAFLGIAVAGTLAALYFLLSSRYPLALGDYAEWTYHGVLFRDVLQGHPDAAYQLKHYPVPNSLSTIGLGLLMVVFSWKTAAALWLVALSSFGFFSAYSLARASGKLQGWQLVVIASAVLFGGAFWYGFTNFLLGVYFAMLLCALLLRGRLNPWLLSLILTFAFFSHMIPFAFAMLALLLYAQQTRDSRLLLTVVPGLCLSAWYFIGRFSHGNVDGQAGMTTLVPYMTPTFAAFKVNTFFKSFGFVNPANTFNDSVLLRQVGPAIHLLLFSADIVIATAVLVLLIRHARRSFRQRSTARFLWLSIAISFVLALFMPGTAAGISDPGGRVMELATWCGLLLVAADTRWAQAALGACATGLLTANLFLLATVASASPMSGADTSPFPARIRQFGHILYAAHWFEYGKIQQDTMNVRIYPTAVFIEKNSAHSAPQK